ncbi:Type II secretion envelope pseudopilin protein (PulG,guides folded protein to PulD in outer membrane) [hydrothermal vent metagenome]|uniref:Type II secretion envelope pseudopilin protein (PulG,guides folded protein to PulD in outer membrane) n=1 Tax=hydrothermal vent metagenome TaxID=652676 RepID=A0A1W1BA70_9ZZZZ
MNRNRHAFTMMELIFVIIVIGILSAVALPKFSATRDDAIISKARTTVASIRTVLTTEKQKRILRGNFDDMNKTFIGDDSSSVFTNVLEYPEKKCANSEQKNCWTVGGTEAAPTYTYVEPTGTKVKFNLTKNRLVCAENCDNFKF